MKIIQWIKSWFTKTVPEQPTSRSTSILTSNGNQLRSIAAQNVTDSSGAITIEVDTLETPTTIGTGDVQLRDNSSALEYTNNAGSNWSAVGNDADAIHNDVTGEIAAITEKASPIGADLILIEDSAASNAKKKVQITNLPGGSDDDAIHDNVSGEIAAVTEKASPVGADLILIEDSAASNAKKRVQITNLPGSDSNAIHDNVTGEISAITEKTTPVAADLLLIEDSAASNAKKKLQITNLPSASPEIQVTKTGTTYSPTAAECEDLTVWCSTGSNTIELVDPATGRPGSVRVFALDTNTVTVTASASNINDLSSTGNQYENSDVAGEWVWFLFDHTNDYWMVFQENGSWTLTAGGK